MLRFEYRSFSFFKNTGGRQKIACDVSFCLIGEECDEMTHKDNIKCSDFTDDNDLDEISELRGMRSDLGRILSSKPL